MLNKAKVQGIFSGIKINDQGNEVYVLQFADDTVILIKNDLTSVLCVKKAFNVLSYLVDLKSISTRVLCLVLKEMHPLYLTGPLNWDVVSDHFLCHI